MSYKHYPTDEFLKKAKAIKKVYNSFGSDLKGMRKVIDKLSSFKNQPQIDDLGGGLFKYRLEIDDKNISKSYGARIIFFYLNQEGELWYLTCYDKSDKGDISKSEEKEYKKLAKEIEKASPRPARLRKFGSERLAPRKRITRAKRAKK
jgi:hypothetical protein